MSATNVTKLVVNSKRSKTAVTKVRSVSASQKRRLANQRFVAIIAAVLAVILIGLSLDHLAQAVDAITHSGPTRSAATAIGGEACYIVFELGQLVISEKLREELRVQTGLAIKGTLLASALMNSYAFAAHATSYAEIAADCAFGCAIPALIFVVTNFAARLWLDATRH